MPTATAHLKDTSVRLRLGIFVLLAAALGVGPLSAQEPDSPAACPLFQRLSATREEWDCFRLRSTGLPEVLAAPDDSARSTVAGMVLQTSPARLYSGFRSAYPLARNRGLVWGGRGASGFATAGVSLSHGPLVLNIEPEIAYSENRAFELPERADGSAGRSPYAYPWGRVLDWPMRFGDEPLTSFSPGQSYLEVSLGGTRMGVSNENLWLSPARRYPLLLGNSAPGFPHLYLERFAPIGSPIGEFRAGIVWGVLEESDYFRTSSGGRRRILTALHGSWSPSFLEGLDLGLTGTVQEQVEDGFDLAYFSTIFKGFPLAPSQSARVGPADGKASVYARWRFPEPGFEVYGEWGFNDFWAGTEDLLTEPDHASGYVWGFERSEVPEGSSSGWKLMGEMVSLKTPRSRWQGIRADGANFYSHSKVRQGHTHEGRLLGAYVGSGSDAQYLAFERWRPEQRWSAFAERVRWDDDSYFQYFAENYGFVAHDIEWTLGGSYGRNLGPFVGGLQTGVSRRKNRQFVGLDGISWDFRREWNLWFDLDLVLKTPF